MAGRPVTLDLLVRGRRLTTPGRPLVMGILNVTPDSFSDGGRHASVDAAMAHAARMADEGADILDVGGESTRPGALPVSVEEEIARVVPVLEAIRDAGLRPPVSIDTRHAVVARAALDAGAAMVNDVSALDDPPMASLVAARGVPVVLMHMKGTPATMQGDPRYTDVVAEVAEHLALVRGRALAAGVAPGQILLDPGLGFGKRTGQGVEDNATLLSRLPELHQLGHPLVVGASRKRFLAALSGGAPVGDRLAASLSAAVAAAWAGAHVLRVHDVAPSLQALRVAAALDPSRWATHWGVGAVPPAR